MLALAGLCLTLAACHWLSINDRHVKIRALSLAASSHVVITDASPAHLSKISHTLCEALALQAQQRFLAAQNACDSAGASLQTEPPFYRIELKLIAAQASDAEQAASGALVLLLNVYDDELAKQGAHSALIQRAYYKLNKQYFSPVKGSITARSARHLARKLVKEI